MSNEILDFNDDWDSDYDEDPEDRERIEKEITEAINKMSPETKQKLIQTYDGMDLRQIVESQYFDDSNKILGVDNQVIKTYYVDIQEGSRIKNALAEMAYNLYVKTTAHGSWARDPNEDELKHATRIFACFEKYIMKFMNSYHEPSNPDYFINMFKYFKNNTKQLNGTFNRMLYLDIFPAFKPTYEEFLDDKTGKLEMLDGIIRRRAGGFTFYELKLLQDFQRNEYFEKFLNLYSKMKRDCFTYFNGPERDVALAKLNESIKMFANNTEYHQLTSEINTLKELLKHFKNLLKQFSYYISIENALKAHILTQEEYKQKKDYYDSFHIANILKKSPLGLAIYDNYSEYLNEIRNERNMSDIDELYTLREWSLNIYLNNLKEYTRKKIDRT